MRTTLLKARERRGLSPEQLAEQSGVHRATVYRIESGDIKNPSNDTVRKLEGALGLKPGSLVFGDDAADSPATKEQQVAS